MLAKAEDKILIGETKIKALTAQIIDLGGMPPSDQEMHKLGLKIAAKEQEAKNKKEEQKIDLGDEDLSKLDLD